MSSTSQIFIGLSVGLVVVLIIIAINSKSKRFRAWNYLSEKGRGLQTLASEAIQNGATHFNDNGPAISFYRERNGKVESCFAEYSMASHRYEWVEPPTTGWHFGGDKMPDDALPLF